MMVLLPISTRAWGASGVCGGSEVLAASRATGSTGVAAWGASADRVVSAGAADTSRARSLRIWTLISWTSKKENYNKFNGVAVRASEYKLYALVTVVNRLEAASWKQKNSNFTAEQGHCRSTSVYVTSRYSVTSSIVWKAFVWIYKRKIFIEENETIKMVWLHVILQLGEYERTL